MRVFRLFYLVLLASLPLAMRGQIGCSFGTIPDLSDTTTVLTIGNSQCLTFTMAQLKEYIGASGEANVGSNLGAGEGVYASKVDSTLQFKSLVGGSNVSLTSDANTITINASGGGASEWTDAVDYIYNTDTGPVIIGANSLVSVDTDRARRLHITDGGNNNEVALWLKSTRSDNRLQMFWEADDNRLGAWSMWDEGGSASGEAFSMTFPETTDPENNALGIRNFGAVGTFMKIFPTHIRMPPVETVNKPSAFEGNFYYDSDTKTFEFYASDDGTVGGLDWYSFPASGGSGGGTFNVENTSTAATSNTDNVYQNGSIGVGDFSSTTVGAPIQVLNGDPRIRLSDNTASTDSDVSSSVEFFRGNDLNKVGEFGFLSALDGKLTFSNIIAGEGIGFRTEGTEKIFMDADGSIQLSQYGSGTFAPGAAPPTYNLVVDAAGNILEGSLTSGGGATVSAYTPTGIDDITGSVGDLAYNDTALYVKNALGWHYLPLNAMAAAPSGNNPPSGLYARFKASSGVTRSGAAVTQWTDTELGISLTVPPEGASPTFDGTGVAGNNNQPFIAFDGVDDALIYEGTELVDFFDTDSSWTVVVVGSVTDVTQNSTLFIVNNETNDGEITYLHVRGLDQTSRFIRNENNVDFQDAFFNDSPTNNTFYYWEALYSLNDLDVYVNNVAGDQNVDIKLNGQYGPTNFSVGSLIRDSGDVFFGVRVSEILFYKKKLNASERTTLNTYINTEYGL